MGKNVTHITDNGLFSHGKMGKGYEKVVLLKQYRNIFQTCEKKSKWVCIDSNKFKEQ